MRAIRYAVLTAALLSLQPGCGMKDAVGRVGIVLTKVEVRDFDNTGFDAVLHMRVDNPNWFGMRIAGLDYQAYVGGQRMAWGSLDKEVEIPGEGSATAELPLTVRYADLQHRLDEVLRGRMGYRVTGYVVFKTWMGRYTLPFDTEKTPEGGRHS